MLGDIVLLAVSVVLVSFLCEILGSELVSEAGPSA